MTVPWDACTGDPCTCPKPDTAVAENARRLAWFTDNELRDELARRAAPLPRRQPTPTDNSEEQR